MSYQRRHGQWALVAPQALVQDERGNEQYVADTSDAALIRVRAVFWAERAVIGEVPGQQFVQVVNMIVDYGLPNVWQWSRVYWEGTWWDVESPPAVHFGTRHTKHWTIPIRRRPDGERTPGIPVTPPVVTP